MSQGEKWSPTGIAPALQSSQYGRSVGRPSNRLSMPLAQGYTQPSSLTFSTVRRPRRRLAVCLLGSIAFWQVVQAMGNSSNIPFLKAEHQSNFHQPRQRLVKSCNNPHVQPRLMSWIDWNQVLHGHILQTKNLAGSPVPTSTPF
jgi:hypothetical protein